MQLFSNTDITICDTCNADNLISYNTSDDGASASNVVLVDKGKINNVMTDYYTSSIYNIKDTGNGRSLSFDKHPIPRMRNTYLKNGTKTRQELFDSGNEFIYALDIGGGNVNTKTGDFVFHIQVAMVIKNGKPTAIIPPFLYRGMQLMY